MRFVLLAALLGLGVSASNAVHAACTGPTPDQAEAFFAEWQSTLSSGDATRLRQLYAADAVVFGLDTAHPATTAPDLSREFQALTQLGVVAPKSRTIATGCGVVRDYGTLVVKERQRTSTLRFSRVYELRDGRWLLTLDHLSLGRGSASIRSNLSK